MWQRASLETRSVASVVTTPTMEQMISPNLMEVSQLIISLLPTVGKLLILWRSKTELTNTVSIKFISTLLNLNNKILTFDWFMFSCPSHHKFLHDCLIRNSLIICYKHSSISRKICKKLTKFYRIGSRNLLTFDKPANYEEPLDIIVNMAYWLKTLEQYFACDHRNMN